MEYVNGNVGRCIGTRQGAQEVVAAGRAVLALGVAAPGRFLPAAPPPLIRSTELEQRGELQNYDLDGPSYKHYPQS
jgi:hypothetical protein